MKLPAPPTGTGVRRSYLARYLATVCALLIAYSSLQPFGGWTAPPAGAPFFLFAMPNARQPWSDIWINLLAYLPLGLFTALIRRRDGRVLGPRAALLVSFTLSLAMETLQTALPQRVSSIVDLATNTAGGALGAAIAVLLEHRPGWRIGIQRWRSGVFLSGPLGDLGLTLLGIWLLAQVNPAIPPFGISVQPGLPEIGDPADYLLVASQIGFDAVGVCLFVRLLLRRGQHGGLAIAAVVALAFALKTATAAAMLTVEAWRHWLHPAITLGIAGGLLTLLAVQWLPRPARTALCSVCLLTSLVMQLLAAEPIFTREVLTLFDWRYGQLLNFNGLTQAVLMAWPLLVSAYLFALAGRPDWGRDELARL